MAISENIRRNRAEINEILLTPLKTKSYTAS